MPMPALLRILAGDVHCPTLSALFGPPPKML
jgi:hypothetical protein